MIKLISKQSEAFTTDFPPKTDPPTPNNPKLLIAPIQLKHNSRKKRFSNSQIDRIPSSKCKALKLTFLQETNKLEESNHLDRVCCMVQGNKNVKKIQLDYSPQETKAGNQMEQTRSIFTVGSSYICPGDYVDSSRWEDKREIIKLKHPRRRAVSPIDKLVFRESSEAQYVRFEGKV